MNRIAIVTGASSGLGYEFLKSLLKDNNTYHLEEVWAVARRMKKIEALAKRFPGRVRPISADLNSSKGMSTIQGMLENENPMVVLLINSAGRGEAGSFERLSLQEQMKTIKLNALSLTGVTGLALPYMSRGARIINMASGSAFSPQPFFAVYAATKAFVLSFSRALNSELKEREISVTAVCPGPVRTAFFRHGGMGNPAWFKRLFMEKPQRTVKRALRDAFERRPVSTTSVPMAVFRILSKILPNGLIVSFETLLQRK
ncbi:MAG: SDR family NAD(P)-dependent oxidoreductase [Lachnospiraceae bacterium]|nr:SDR family NAD(P)-dependent oxidoreductase [Lachnospiraceae bacterium]